MNRFVLAIAAASILLLTGCSATTETVTTSTVAEPAVESSPTPLPVTKMTIPDMVPVIVPILVRIDEAAIFGSDLCKAYMIGGMVGLDQSDPAMKSTIDTCWAQLDEFLAAGSDLKAALGPYFTEGTLPEPLETPAMGAMLLFPDGQSEALTPECRNGTSADADACNDMWGEVYFGALYWQDTARDEWLTPFEQ